MNALLGILLAILSGLLLGVSSPALNLWALGLIALIPFYYLLEKSEQLLHVAVFGFIVGSIATGIYTWPLTSASTWVGWAEFTQEQSQSHKSTYSSSLFLIWTMLTLVAGGVLFSIFSIIIHYLIRIKMALTLMVSAPIFWLIIIEYSRNLIFFDYQWMPIGSLFINIPWLAQLAAYGGLWLLGALVILINSLLYLCFFKLKSKKSINWILTSVITVISLSIVGGLRYNTINGKPQNLQEVKIATIQLSQTQYTEYDYTPFYMDKHYLRLVKQAYEKHSDKFDILVLPESIGFGSVSLDGTKSLNAPDKTLSTIQDWYNAVKPIILKPSLLIFGIDTVEYNKDYNSIVVWNEKGPIWKYHKQRLVPFAESIPDGFFGFGPKGNSSYYPGFKINNLKLNKAQIGFFICQEVLFSDIINKSVLKGAEFLVTVGNDGVFSNPSVAKNNHIAAQFRAIESNRYIVRSMKSGISSIITPTGEAKNSLGNNEKGLIASKIIPRNDMTIYTLMHNYIIWLLLIVAVILLLFYKIFARK